MPRTRCSYDNRQGRLKGCWLPNELVLYCKSICKLKDLTAGEVSDKLIMFLIIVEKRNVSMENY